MEPYFIFKGKNSRDFGILISEMPDIVKPQRREQEVTIPGRSGVLTIDENAYESYTLSIACGKRGTERLGEIVAWLDGSGDLTLSTEPDKVYRARISNAISISDVIYLYNSFLVQFKVFPFKYSLNAVRSHADNLVLTVPTSIKNKGSVYSEPTITIHGAGNITLIINGTNYGLLGVAEYITINSEMMEVYKGKVNCNNKFSALDFPRLEVGMNTISWTGNVTKIEVEPKWRWL
ncbi:distal tail protein Dit [Anaerotignum sp. MB30-C6]|uniref:distal tail protein Dit n=1 Tax=Anaerotignum sp. MB30-C6 TaxID=3070814 RepID=UPI0027DB4C18|nr:distal tail protein Dit [Anaerotignum sp. MB30-C6]WMI81950.1 phage tail family protein [Anaerotignum sp. MB30-C6]